MKQLQDLMAGWKTKAMAVVFGGKVVAVDQYELLLQDMDDLFNLAINAVAVALIYYLRQLGVLRERAKEESAKQIEKMRAKFE